MFNNYYSISIPCGKKLKNVVVRAKDEKIDFVEGINEISTIGKIKN